MTPKLSCFYIARFVLQAETAFAVNSGLRDGAFDSLIVRDVNGLPAIPGTSLAGVLRHQFEALHGSKSVHAVFGYARKDQGDASRLHVSWGCIHDRKDEPVEDIRLKMKGDTILERLQLEHPYHRERVSINCRGVAKDTGKFDQTVVPAGCRFSFEISYWSETLDDPFWAKILQLLQAPLQIGASTRSGLGWFNLVRLSQLSLDLKTEEGWNKYKKIGSSLADLTELKEYGQQQLSNPIQATLKLEAEDFWRFGQPGDALNKQAQDADATPLAEPVIEWNNNMATLTPRQVVVPASGVKGALAHRVKFHYKCLNQDFSPPPKDDKDDPYNQTNILFGFANDRDKDKGQAGLILLKDVYVKQFDTHKFAPHITHNSIDRFTGGVRDKVLYTEEVIWKQQFSLSLQVDPVRLHYLEQDGSKKSELDCYKKALKQALEDLLEGRLALGAGSAKGHGYFSGSIEWTDQGKWIGADHD